jgi:hypothetical protein
MVSWITIVAGAIIAVLVLMWLIKVIQATVKTAVIVAAIVFALNFFGIGPGNLVQALLNMALGATVGQPK